MASTVQLKTKLLALQMETGMMVKQRDLDSVIIKQIREVIITAKFSVLQIML